MALKLRDLNVMQNPKLQKAAVIIGAALILLIFVSSVLPSGSDDSGSDLEQRLEARLEAMLSDIGGVSCPQVMLTVAPSESRGYGVLSDSEYSFQVRGVTVVCGGADNPLIKEKVVNAVSGALGIGAGKVYVTC